jgi:hypothetical protein
MSDTGQEIAVSDVTLIELVNRVLDRGVVVSGEVLISVAGIDLVYLGLELCLTSIETARRRSLAKGGGR